MGWKDTSFDDRSTLFNTAAHLERKKGMLHRKLCHHLMRYARVEEYRAQIVLMVQKHNEFA